MQHGFEDVLSEYGPMMARIAGSYEADRARREDLMQDLALALWQALPSYRGDGSLKAFVARIAHNRCVSHVAREVRVPSGPEVRDDLPLDTPSPEDAASHRQARRQLMQAVRQLPVGQRQVVVLLLEGFSHREAADALGISEGNVAVRFNRAKTELSSVLRANNAHGASVRARAHRGKVRV